MRNTLAQRQPKAREKRERHKPQRPIKNLLTQDGNYIICCPYFRKLLLGRARGLQVETDNFLYEIVAVSPERVQPFKTYLGDIGMLYFVPTNPTRHTRGTGHIELIDAAIRAVNHLGDMCVFSSHPFWTSSSLDVPAGVTQEEGHTGFLIHLPSAVRALIFVARRIQPFLSLVDCEVEFCVLTN